MIEPRQVEPATFEAVKLALRITSMAFDDEITLIILAGLQDLTNAGVTNTAQTDSLILRALTIYAKGHFGFNDDSEKFIKSYEMLKISLSLAGDYIGAVG